MKKTISIILAPVLLLFLLINFNALPIETSELKPQENKSVVFVHSIKDKPLTDVRSDRSESNKIAVNQQENSELAAETYTYYKADGNSRQNIVQYARTLIGIPYLFGGSTTNGFDCSGFTSYVFEQNGILIKRSSGLQATEGIAIDRSKAGPGDLVIFTGTDKALREPGHVGIVISEPGDTIEFIHSSSSTRDGGVKISQVEGSGYDARFLEVRRVLD